MKLITLGTNCVLSQTKCVSLVIRLASDLKNNIPIVTNRCIYLN